MGFLATYTFIMTSPTRKDLQLKFSPAWLTSPLSLPGRHLPTDSKKKKKKHLHRLSAGGMTTVSWDFGSPAKDAGSHLAPLHQQLRGVTAASRILNALDYCACSGPSFYGRLPGACKRTAYRAALRDAGTACCARALLPPQARDGASGFKHIAPLWRGCAGAWRSAALRQARGSASVAARTTGLAAYLKAHHLCTSDLQQDAA